MSKSLDHEQSFELAFNDLDKASDAQLEGSARSAFSNLFPIYDDLKIYDLQVVVVRQWGKATATVRAWRKDPSSDKK